MKFLKNIIITIVFTLAAIFIIESILKSETPPLPIRKKMEIGEGGPGSRRGFDWLRLHNPQTKKIPAEIRRREFDYAKTLPTRKSLPPKRLKSSLASGASLTWKNRGPYSVGGRTRALVLDSKDENLMFAGGVSGGIWRTEDGGNSWAKMTKSHQLHSVTAIVQDKRTGYEQVWYAGTGEARGNSAGSRGAPYRGDGIYKSNDNGFNWELLPATTTGNPHKFDHAFNYTWRIIVHPNSGHVYSANYGSIHKSENGGETWRRVLGNASSNFTDLAVSKKGTVYAALNSNENPFGIFRSQNSDDWVNITPPGFPAEYDRIVLDAAPSNDSILFVVGNNEDEHFLWRYHYLTGDGSGNGGEWEDRSEHIISKFNSQNGYDLLIRISPADENLVFLGGTNLYFSTNGFKDNFERWIIGGYGHDDHHPDQHEVAFLNSDPYKIISASDGGVHYLPVLDGDNPVWTSLNNGYVTTQFYTVSIDPSGEVPDLVIGGTQDNGTWISTDPDEASTWHHVLGGDGAYCSVIQKGRAFILSSQNGYMVIKDFNNPFEWNYGSGPYNQYSWAYLRPDGLEDDDFMFINPFLSDPSDEKILYLAGGEKVWRNNNVILNNENYEKKDGQSGYRSKNWEELRTKASGSISAFGCSQTNPRHRLYYGTSSGAIYRLDDAHTSIESKYIRKSNLPGGFISSISVNPNDGNKVIISFSNYEIPSIFYSDNGGESWVDVGGNLEEMSSGYGAGPSIRSVLIFPLKDGYRYFAATSTGLYSTSELNGWNTEWVLEGEDILGNIVVDMIKGRPVDGVLAAATHGNGIFSAAFSEDVLATAKDVGFLPETISLGQNFPNPFNPTTIIPFHLKEKGIIFLTIYDIRGRVVKPLVNGIRDKGYHQIKWDGKNVLGEKVSSGVYLYTLKVGDFSVTKQMQFLK